MTEEQPIVQPGRMEITLLGPALAHASRIHTPLCAWVTSARSVLGRASTNNVGFLWRATLLATKSSRSRDATLVQGNRKWSEFSIPGTTEVRNGSWA